MRLKHHAAGDPDQTDFQTQQASREYLVKKYNAEFGANVPTLSDVVHHAGEALGERQNNPQNLTSWGTRPVRNGFAAFDTPDDGIQAAAKNILAYRDVDHVDTMGAIIDRIVPAKDPRNNPEAYKQFVTGKTGWDRKQKLNEDDPDVMFKLLKASFNKEQGHDPYSDDFLMANVKKGIAGYYSNHPNRLPGGTPLPENDPNGARERAAGTVNVTGSADIRLTDTSGRPIGRGTAQLKQAQGQPAAAGTGP